MVIANRPFPVSPSSFIYPPVPPRRPRCSCVPVSRSSFIFPLCPGRHLCPGVPVCDFSLSVPGVIYIPCVPVVICVPLSRSVYTFVFELVFFLVFLVIAHDSNDCPWALLMVIANRTFPVSPSSFIYPPVPPGVPVVVVSLCPRSSFIFPVSRSSFVSRCPGRCPGLYIHSFLKWYMMK